MICIENLFGWTYPRGLVIVCPQLRHFNYAGLRLDYRHIRIANICMAWLFSVVYVYRICICPIAHPINAQGYRAPIYSHLPHSSHRIRALYIRVINRSIDIYDEFWQDNLSPCAQVTLVSQLFQFRPDKCRHIVILPISRLWQNNQ